MLFIYGEEDGRYEVVDSSDGTGRFYTLGELGEIKVVPAPSRRTGLRRCPGKARI